MQRRLLPLTSRILLILFVATIAMWLRSGQRDDSISWDTRTGRVTVGSAYGRVGVNFIHGISLGPIQRNSFPVSPERWKERKGFLGFAWHRESVGSIGSLDVYIRYIDIPYWAVSAVLITLSLLFVYRSATRLRPVTSASSL